MFVRRGRGELESQVMGVLWRAELPLAAREIQDALPGPDAAITTVLTALDRLHEKGLVERIGEGPRGLKFAPRVTEEEHVARSMLSRLQSSSDRGAALAHFAGSLDSESLDLLRRAVRDR